jgi:hypothetical protein
MGIVFVPGFAVSGLDAFSCRLVLLEEAEMAGNPWKHDHH